MSSVYEGAMPNNRKNIVAGNGKMNKTRAEARELAEALKSGLSGLNHLPEVIIIPPFTALSTVGEIIRGTNIRLGAQNMDYRNAGAYTGEISPIMLKELDVEYVLVGHSERRQYFGESNQTTNLRVKAAFTHSLLPILCVGESLDERESNLTDAVVSRQVAAALTDVEKVYLPKLVVAYEPVWAIGTGKNCEAEEANRVAQVIRQTLHSQFVKAGANSRDADVVPILYGGSVNTSNIEAQVSSAIDQIDGVLVGGASLKADDFLFLVRATQKRIEDLRGTAVRS